MTVSLVATSAAAITVVKTWADLPQEVFQRYIVPRLSVKDLQSLALVSKRYHAMTIDSACWDDYRMLARFIDFFIEKLGGVPGTCVASALRAASHRSTGGAHRVLVDEPHWPPTESLDREFAERLILSEAQTAVASQDGNLEPAAGASRTSVLISQQLGRFVEERQKLLEIAEAGGSFLEVTSLNSLKTRLLHLRGRVLHVLLGLPAETLEGLVQPAAPRMFKKALLLVKIYGKMRQLEHVPMAQYFRSQDWEKVWSDLTKLGEADRAVPFVPGPRRDEFLHKVGRGFAERGNSRGVFRAAPAIRDDAMYNQVLKELFGILVAKADIDVDLLCKSVQSIAEERRRDCALHEICSWLKRKGDLDRAFREVQFICDESKWGPVLVDVCSSLVLKRGVRVFEDIRAIQDLAKRDSALSSVCTVLADSKSEKKVERAFKEVQSVRDESKWGPALANICRSLVVKKGDQVFEDIRGVEDEAKRDSALSAACIALVQPLEYRWEGGRYTNSCSEKDAERAFEVALEIRNQEKWGSVLSVISDRAVQMAGEIRNQEKRASALPAVSNPVVSLSEKIHAIPDRERREFSLTVLCYSLVKRHCLEEAFKQAAAIHDDEKVASIWLEGFRSGGDSRHLFKLTQTIRDEERRDRALLALCQALAEQGRVDDFLRLVCLIRSDAAKQSALSAIGERFAKEVVAPDCYSGRLSWHLLLDFHRRDRELLQRILGAVCSALVQLGDERYTLLAIEGGDRIFDQTLKDSISLDVCKALVAHSHVLNARWGAHRGDPYGIQALHVARTISDDEKRGCAFQLLPEASLLFPANGSYEDRDLESGIYEVLAERGDVDEAFTKAAAIRDDRLREFAFSTIYRVLMKRGDIAHALQHAKTIKDGRKLLIDSLHREIGDFLRENGPTQKFLLALDSIEEDEWRDRILSAVCCELASHEEGRFTELVLEKVQNICDEEKRGEALSSLCSALSSYCEYSEGLDEDRIFLLTTQKLSDEKRKPFLVRISESLAKCGEIAQLLELIKVIQDEQGKDNRAKTFSFICDELPRHHGGHTGRVEKVLEAIDFSDDDQWRDAVLISISRRLAGNGKKFTGIALDLAHNIRDEEKRGEALSFVCDQLPHSYGYSGNLDADREFLLATKKLSNEKRKPFLIRICESLARCGEIAQLLELIKAIQDEQGKDKREKTFSFICDELPKHYSFPPKLLTCHGGSAGRSEKVPIAIDVTNDDQWRDAVLISISRHLARSMERSTRIVLDLVQNIRDEEKRCDELSRYCYSADQDADRMFLLTTKKLSDEKRKPFLMRISESLARCGEIAQLFELIKTIQDEQGEDKRAKTFSFICDKLPKHDSFSYLLTCDPELLTCDEGFAGRAEEVPVAIDFSNDDQWRDAVSISFSRRLSRNGGESTTLALEIVQSIRDEKKREEALSFVCHGLSHSDRMFLLTIEKLSDEKRKPFLERICDSLVRCGEIAQLLALMEAIQDRREQERVLDSICQPHRYREWGRFFSTIQKLYHEKRKATLARVGVVLAGRGDVDVAIKLAQEVGCAMYPLCIVLASEGNREGAFEVAKHIDNEEDRDAALTYICERVSHSDGSEAEFLQVAQHICNEESRERAAQEFCAKFMEFDKTPEAVAIACAIDDKSIREAVLQALGRECTEAGKTSEVVVIARTIADESKRDAVLEGLCRGLFGSGESSQAVAIARTIVDESKRDAVLADLCKKLSEQFSWGGETNASEVVAIARTIVNESKRDSVLESLCKKLSEQGKTREAVDIACTIADESKREAALWDIGGWFAAPKNSY